MSTPNLKKVELTATEWFELFNAIRQQEVEYQGHVDRNPGDDYFLQNLQATQAAKAALLKAGS